MQVRWECLCRFAFFWKTTTEKHWASTGLKLYLWIWELNSLPVLTIIQNAWILGTAFDLKRHRHRPLITTPCWLWVICKFIHAILLSVWVCVCVCIPSVVASGCFYRSKMVPVSSVLLQLRGWDWYTSPTPSAPSYQVHCAVLFSSFFPYDELRCCSLEILPIGSERETKERKETVRCKAITVCSVSVLGFEWAVFLSASWCSLCRILLSPFVWSRW